jgi:aromatic-L-amino-acid decarboxylase
MDWSAKALGLPDSFMLNNSGGGIINNSTTESVLVTVHAAKRKKMTELDIKEIDPRILKFVGYYSEFAHNGG